MRDNKKRTGVSKAEALRVAQRVEEVLRIRLARAQFWDVREYVREKEQEDGSPWKLAEGARPLSDGQLRRYIQRADRLILASVKEKRSKAIRRHLAQRENLYALAVNAGDIRTALAVAQDEARLRGLYPPTKFAPTTPDGKDQWTPVLKEASDEDLAVLARLAERGRQVAAGGGNRDN